MPEEEVKHEVIAPEADFSVGDIVAAIEKSLGFVVFVAAIQSDGKTISNTYYRHNFALEDLAEAGKAFRKHIQEDALKALTITDDGKN